MKNLFRLVLTVISIAFFTKNVAAQDEWLSRSTPGISARYIHTSVWTGDSMIVWGGTGAGTFNTGAIFTPDNNSWATMSTLNAPTARSQHSAVWTGSEMIVWGGGNSTYVNTGGRYSPKNDTWQATSTVNAPSGRWGAAAFWTGTKMIIWGGSAPNAGYNDGALYDPVTDTWSPMSSVNAPSQRIDAKFAWTGTEFIVWGGSFNNTDLITGAAYNPQTDTWRTIATPTGFSGRGFIKAVWSGQEMIIWGGGSVSASSTFFDTGARYNPTTDSWTLMTTTGAPQARAHFDPVWTGSHYVVFGGAGTGFVQLNTGGKYDPTTDTWTALTTVSAPSARRHHTSIWTGVSMLVYGGYNGSGINSLVSWSPQDFSDSIANSWRTEYFGSDYRHKNGSAQDADPDKDGSDNLTEYTAETSPIDAAEGFASNLVITPTVNWYSIPGRTYKILRKNDLNDANWTVLTNSFVASEGYSTYYDTSSSQSQGYYLVEIVPL